jgi:Bacterial regulatory helix-turn-helix protein, lysR family
MNVMHFQKLDLNLLVVFRSLMTYRRVTGAAGALNLSQSAASHALSRLRRFYADPLFVRNGQTMEPTARALEIDQDVQEATAKIVGTFKTEFDPKHLAREFRIALVKSEGFTWCRRCSESSRPRRLMFTSMSITFRPRKQSSGSSRASSIFSSAISWVGRRASKRCTF